MAQLYRGGPTTRRGSSAPSYIRVIYPHGANRRTRVVHDFVHRSSPFGGCGDPRNSGHHPACTDIHPQIDHLYTGRVYTGRIFTDAAPSRRVATPISPCGPLTPPPGTRSWTPTRCSRPAAAFGDVAQPRMPSARAKRRWGTPGGHRRNLRTGSTPHRVKNPQVSEGLSEWALPGSNRRHPRCKRGALPAELKALMLRV